MSELLSDFKANIEAVLVIAGAISALGSAVWKFAILPVRSAVARIERVIGNNDGSSVFDKLEIIASLADVIDQPSLLLSATGEVVSVNLAFTESTGISLAALQHGGWRQLFLRTVQPDWDYSVEHHSVFTCDIPINSRPYRLVAKPMFNATKFLGWRVRLSCMVAK
jgi:PAS domain-containing protein